MAIYTHNGLVGSPTGSWAGRDIAHASAASYISASASLIVYLNSDGSETRILSSSGNFTFTNVGGIITLTGGTITSMQRTNAGGGTVWETITGLSYAATSFQARLADTNLSTIASEIFAGADTFNGGGLNDFMQGFAGNDSINGAGGFDTVSYSHATMTGPVAITIGSSNTVGAATDATGTAVAGSATIGTDTLNSVEQFIGTAGTDSFTAFRNFIGGTGNNFNEFEGLGGNDTITGNLNTRLSFANSFTAGPGATVVWTSGSTNGAGTATGTGIGTDSFTGINAVRGSNFIDTFNASGASLEATGFFNTFTFDGRGGNDLITGGGTNTRWDSNLARYDNESSNVTIIVGTSNAVGAALTDLATATGTSAGADTLHFVESFRGTNNATGDVYTAFANFNGLFGDYNQFEGMAGNDVIIGNGSTRISFSQATGSVAVTWNASATNAFTGDGTAVGDGSVGTDTFTGVDSARGTAGNDTFTATNAHGFFDFNGAGGNDTIFGSQLSINNFDFDTANYSGATSGIAVSFGANAIVSGLSVGADTLFDIERIRGSHFADTYVVDANFFSSFGKLNVFDGGGGDDAITGNGSTRVDYSSAQAGVTVNLGTGIGRSTAINDLAAVGTDTFTGVNGAQGSRFDDVLIGSDGPQAEQFLGGVGNDSINGGGGLRDQATYRNSTSGIVGSLLTGQISDGFGTTDTVVNIEDLRGSEFNDTITGNGLVNYLIGEGGDDTLNGDEGDDILVGDDNNLNLYGGAFGVGTDFDSGNDTLNGGNGADTLVGGLGVDKMFGGTGNDTVYWDANDDLANVLGGADTDTLLIIDQAAPTSFNLTTHEFEAAKRIINDAADAQPYTQVIEDYNASWQLVTTTVKNDDGTSYATTNDVGSSNPWDYYTYYYNALGQMTGAYIHGDSGSSETYVYDPANTLLATYTLTTRNAADQVTNIYTLNDDGSNYGYEYDVGNLYTWATTGSIVDAQGHLTQVQLVNDDNSRIDTVFDVSGSPWTSYRNYLNTTGTVRRAQEGTFDNGTSFVIFRDVDNLQSWEYMQQNFDASHNLVSTVFDQGWLF